MSEEEKPTKKAVCGGEPVNGKCPKGCKKKTFVDPITRERKVRCVPK